MRRVLRCSGLATIALIAIIMGGMALGLFSGNRPTGLGVSGGKLAAPNNRPNNVHSQIAMSDSHYIAPIKPNGDAARAFLKLTEIVRAMPRGRIIADKPDYIYAEFSSPTMGFVDDTEFYLERSGGVIHVRAAARLGIRDFDANRKRIEAVRAQLAVSGS